MSGPPCQAAETNLHLDPSGRVLACCANKLYVLGNVQSASLREIWESQAADDLRADLRAHDYGRGCSDCGAHVAAGHPERAWARAYDGDTVGAHAGTTWPQRLELELSNACNLQCVQCNGDLSSSIRAQRERLPRLPVVYDEPFFAELAAFLPHARSIVFLGGEPFLGREPMRVFAQLVDGGHTPRCHVTTNGTIWNRRVEGILDALPVDISLSLDAADPDLYRSIRIGGDHAKVLTNLDRFLDRARGNGTTVSLNYCLMTANVDDFASALMLADQRDVDVFVNTVTSPPGLSLFRTASDSLRAMLERLREDPVASRLGRNRPVWDDQMGRLAAHLDAAEGAGAPVAVSGSLERTASALAAEAADERGVHRLELSATGLIEAIGPRIGDVLGMDLHPLLGQPIAHMQDVVVTHFGRVTRMSSTAPVAQVEQHEVVCELDGRSTSIRSVIVPRPDGGAVCMIAARATASALA